MRLISLHEVCLLGPRGFASFEVGSRWQRYLIGFEEAGGRSLKVHEVLAVEALLDGRLLVHAKAKACHSLLVMV